MGQFALVSQALRTAEPLQEVQPSALLEKLFYHQQHYANQTKALTTEHIKEVDYMYYAAAVVAVYQLLLVSHLSKCVE